MHYMYYGGGYLGILFNILFWVAIIWLVVYLLQRGRSPSGSPLEIAKMRYVKGEISKKQYEDMKKELRK
jgi:putative membrane protein